MSGDTSNIVVTDAATSQVNKMPTFELISPRKFLEVSHSSLKFDEKTDNFPQKSEIVQLSMIFLG